MYSKQIFVIDMRIRPFKFAKFELSSSILALEIQFMLSETWQSQMKFGSPVGRRFLMGTVYTLYQGCRSRGAKGALAPPPFLADQLTLSQPERGADYAHHDITCLPPRFSDLPTALCTYGVHVARPLTRLLTFNIGKIGQRFLSKTCLSDLMGTNKRVM
jgi:hypothetical protein